jgi:hypothetical protein
MNRPFCLLLFAVSLLFLSAPAEAAPYIRKWSDAQDGTEAAPTSPTVGMSLEKVVTYRVTVCQTTGTLDGDLTEMLVPYVYSMAQAKWVPVPSNIIVVDPKQMTLAACFTTEDLPSTLVPYGRVFYAALGFDSGVTVSIDAATEQ